MARSDIVTLLAPDDYARLMAINPCAFNQVMNPAHSPHNTCEDIWLQNGYTGGDQRIVGREDVAQAISQAEELIANALGFWPAPKWILSDEQPWPVPHRGCQVTWPKIKARWGYVQQGGIEALSIITSGAAITYSDEDGDGVLDTATITVTAAAMAAAGATLAEVEVYYPNGSIYFPCEPMAAWQVRPVTKCQDGAGNVTIIARRCQFVHPMGWLDSVPLSLADNANFLTTVDVYRHYTIPNPAAQLVWNPTGLTLCEGGTGCVEACGDACLIVDDSRVGIVRTPLTSYAAGVWTYTTSTNSGYPAKVRLWYKSGLYALSNAMQEAIVRLANVFLPEAPCGCGLTRQRWDRDREEQDINTIDAALAFSAFGTAARGAVFAWTTVKRLNPLGGGSSL